jgi:hypothetical protein
MSTKKGIPLSASLYLLAWFLVVALMILAPLVYSLVKFLAFLKYLFS